MRREAVAFAPAAAEAGLEGIHLAPHEGHVHGSALARRAFDLHGVLVVEIEQPLPLGPGQAFAQRHQIENLALIDPNRAAQHLLPGARVAFDLEPAEPELLAFGDAQDQVGLLAWPLDRHPGDPRRRAPVGAVEVAH